MEKEKTTKEKLEKLEKVEERINWLLANYFCENTPKELLNYIDHNLEELQELKEKSKTNEQEFLANNCITYLCYLQNIIEIVKGVE